LPRITIVLGGGSSPVAAGATGQPSSRRTLLSLRRGNWSRAADGIAVANMAHQLPSIERVAELLGGEACGEQVLAPGPGTVQKIAR
jgi:hypothetical protein